VLVIAVLLDGADAIVTLGVVIVILVFSIALETVRLRELRATCVRGSLDAMSTQAEKGLAFRELHEGEPFVIPNPWDTGSARALEALGFESLATTSSGFAFTLGRLDGQATLDEVVAHVSELDRATGLPVSVDLENGYATTPPASRARSRASRRQAPWAARSRTGIRRDGCTTEASRSSVSPPRSKRCAGSGSLSR
jgi:hypothetical protein